MQNTSVSWALTAIGRLSRNLTVFPVMCLSIIAAGSHLTAGQQEQQQQQAGEEKPTRGGPQEGIKVHGHWVIEVRNPDGSFVSHTEFENSLATNGSVVLADLLGRQVSQGFWRIRLLSAPNGINPCSVNGDPFPCLIVEPNDRLGESNNIFKNLGVGVGNAGTSTMVLSGAATVSAAQVVSIGSVETRAILCQGIFDAASGSCSGQTAEIPFTARILSQPVNATAGQIVQVTVTISFS